MRGAAGPERAAEGRGEGGEGYFFSTSSSSAITSSKPEVANLETVPRFTMGSELKP